MLSFARKVDHIDITTTIRIYLEHDMIERACLLSKRAFSHFTNPTTLPVPELDIYMLNHILLAFQKARDIPNAEKCFEEIQSRFGHLPKSVESICILIQLYEGIITPSEVEELRG